MSIETDRLARTDDVGQQERGIERQMVSDGSQLRLIAGVEDAKTFRIVPDGDPGAERIGGAHRDVEDGFGHVVERQGGGQATGENLELAGPALGDDAQRDVLPDTNDSDDVAAGVTVRRLGGEERPVAVGRRQRLLEGHRDAALNDLTVVGGHQQGLFVRQQLGVGAPLDVAAVPAELARDGFVGEHVATVEVLHEHRLRDALRQNFDELVHRDHY